MKRWRVHVVLIAASCATLALAQEARQVAPKTPASGRAPQAQTTPGPVAQSKGDGGISAIQPCVACHGERGEGQPQAGFPRLAGQSQAYLLHQLESYANGSRRHPVMEPIAKGLSRDARAAASAHYAGVQPPPAQARQDTRTNERGEQLAVRGDDSRQVQACANCHGPGGTGEPPEIPYLAGIDAEYLASTLNAFRSGARRNDAGQQMRTVARALSVDDINAVAQYFASLAPPARAAPDNIVRPPTGPGPRLGGSARGDTTTSTQPAAPRGQVGVEQGAGTTGGTQGQGGSDQSSATNRSEPSKGR
ncbi:MAG: c-type cytochrome [Burkholderiaceae bacterium]